MPPPPPPPSAAQVEPARAALPKRPGGRPVAAQPRVKRISVSLTEQEHQRWLASAGARAPATWAREMVNAQLEDGGRESDAAEVAKLRADLGRVGSNLNQIMRAINQGLIPEIPGLKEAVVATRAELAKVRERL